MTEKIEKHFKSNPREYLPISFLGITIKTKKNGFFMERHTYISNSEKSLDNIKIWSIQNRETRSCMDIRHKTGNSWGR